MTPFKPLACCPHCRKAILTPYQAMILDDVKANPETTSKGVCERLNPRRGVLRCNVHACMEFLRKHGFLTRAMGYDKRWRYSAV